MRSPGCASEIGGYLSQQVFLSSSVIARMTGFLIIPMRTSLLFVHFLLHKVISANSQLYPERKKCSLRSQRCQYFIFNMSVFLSFCISGRKKVLPDPKIFQKTGSKIAKISQKDYKIIENPTPKTCPAPLPPAVSSSPLDCGSECPLRPPSPPF